MSATNERDIDRYREDEAARLRLEHRRIMEAGLRHYHNQLRYIRMQRRIEARRRGLQHWSHVP